MLWAGCCPPSLLTQAGRALQGWLRVAQGMGREPSSQPLAHVLNPIPPAQLVHPVTAQLLPLSPVRLACRSGLALVCHWDLTPMCQHCPGMRRAGRVRTVLAALLMW